MWPKSIHLTTFFMSTVWGNCNLNGHFFFEKGPNYPDPLNPIWLSFIIWSGLALVHFQNKWLLRKKCLLVWFHHVRHYRFRMKPGNGWLPRMIPTKKALLKWLHHIIFVSNVFHNSHLIQKCIQNQQQLLILYTLHNQMRVGKNIRRKDGRITSL